MKFIIERFDPDQDEKPYFKEYDIQLEPSDRMLLDALIRIKSVDDTLALRRSCREGVCGSDAMNINGKNGLACITKISELKEPVKLRPLPGLPIIRDLIVDMTQFFKQYNSIKPFVINNDPPPEKERLQSPEDRLQLDGLYECILCACCSTAWTCAAIVKPGASSQHAGPSPSDGRTTRLRKRGTRCSRASRWRRSSQSAGARPPKRIVQPTCIGAFGVSSARKEASRALRRSRAGTGRVDAEPHRSSRAPPATRGPCVADMTTRPLAAGEC